MGVELRLDGRTTLPLEPRFEHALVVLEGGAVVGGVVVAPGALAYLGPGRDELVLAATDPTLYRGVRGGETFVELTYQYQLRPWWQLQPDLQVVFNPGGGIADPNEPTARVKDEVVLGLRTNVLF